MYLKTMTAKGKKYIYLYRYKPRKEPQEIKPKTERIFNLGRNDIALQKLKKWKSDYSLFPEELKEKGCTKRDLIDWINTIETGITKTGKNFKAAV